MHRSRVVMRGSIATMVALLALPAGASAQYFDLLFSEYVEGSSNNKALELYNGTSSAIDLSTGQYLVQMYFNGNTTAATTVNLTGSVGAGQTFVLAQNSASFAGAGFVNQTNASSWFNGDDAIVLRKGGAAGAIVDSFGQVGVDPGTAWGTAPTSSINTTLRRLTTVTAGDVSIADAFDPATQWTGHPQDTFDGLGAYPGLLTQPPPATARTIMQIQGGGHTSPDVGSTVSTSGVVTALAANGFYLQDATGDGDVATSDGIFVFTNSAPTVAVGDAVTLGGTVAEFFNMTQLSNPTDITKTGTGSIAPTVIGAGGREAPTRIVDDAGSASFDPAQHGRDFYESVEGMLVTLKDAKAVDAPNRFGEIHAVADQGAGATGMNSRGGITVSPDAAADNPLQADLNPERIQIDPNLASGTNPATKTGDLLGDVTGVVDFSFNDYAIRPTAPVAATDGGLAPEVTTLTSGAGSLTVATFNVLNLDPGDGARFGQLAQQIVDNLKSPDIIALQEVQDNDGQTNSGTVSASQTLQLLADAIAAAGGPTYQVIDNTFIGNNTNGGAPGGNIRTAYLYDPGKVALVVGSLDAVTDPLDQQSNPANPFFDSRLPLAATFEVGGERFTLINNHFSSKGGSDPLFGGVQPPANGGLADRLAQAQELEDYIDALLAGDPDRQFIVLGDFNEFWFYDPLLNLEDGPLANLYRKLPEAERYSYVFEGNSQALDHILVSDSLWDRAEFDAVHINAEFGGIVSDHDPLVARFALATAVATPAPGGVWVVAVGMAALVTLRRRRAA